MTNVLRDVCKAPGIGVAPKGHKCCFFEQSLLQEFVILYPVDLIRYTYDIYIYTIAATCTRNIIYNISNLFHKVLPGFSVFFGLQHVRLDQAP